VGRATVVPLPRLLLGLLTSTLVLAGCSGGGDRDASGGATTTAVSAMDDVVHLNEVQVLGTHNSYHRRLPPALFDLLRRVDARLADSVDYEHRPLDEQLDTGIRQLELDVFADPEGGRYARRAARTLVGEPADTGIAELEEPGFKVLHLTEVDFESSCLSLAACLRTIVEWSDAHPRHLPIMVFVEPKDSPTPDVASLGFVTPAPIDAAALDALDDEIRSIVGDEKLLTPDEVRGDAATLRAAVTENGWPTLAEARGKVLFTLLDDGEKRTRYVEGHPSLRGRAMFTSSGADADESAIVSRPDPVAAAAEIETLVRDGFLVRTRADADTVEARSGATARRDAALASAATWISTDFPQPDPSLGSDYSVELRPRCHPVLAPRACRDDRLEP